jgi:hypothetical protein
LNACSVSGYTFSGRRAEACLIRPIREGKRAVELKPVAKGAFDGPDQLANLALIYAHVGEPDQAISLIGNVLRMPGGVFFGSENELMGTTAALAMGSATEGSALPGDSRRARAQTIF